MTQETSNRRDGKKTKLHNVPHLQKSLLDLNSKGPKCLDVIRATQLAVKLNRMCACRFEDLHASTSSSGVHTGMEKQLGEKRRRLSVKLNRILDRKPKIVWILVHNLSDSRACTSQNPVKCQKLPQ